MSVLTQSNTYRQIMSKAQVGIQNEMKALKVRPVREVRYDKLHENLTGSG